METFTQAHVAESRPLAACSRVEADSIVSHAELQTALLLVQEDFGPEAFAWWA